MASNRLEWHEFAEKFPLKLRNYTPHGTYPEALALVAGFDLAAGGDTLGRFAAWLSDRRKGRPELAFSSQALRIVLDTEEIPPTNRLTPEQTKVAVAGLFDLLREFLAQQQEQ